MTYISLHCHENPDNVVSFLLHPYIHQPVLTYPNDAGWPLTSQIVFLLFPFGCSAL